MNERLPGDESKTNSRNSVLSLISEIIINSDPHVHACLIFGQGKFQNGVLIEPKEEYKFNPKNSTKLEEFRNKIWYASLSHRLCV